MLDDCIQVTDLDECAYHEMISFLPINSHPSPKRVLIIGAGDGGVAREVLKHPLVEEVVLCEIDPAVIRVAKQFFPKLACSFDNPKLKLHVDDGIEYVKRHKHYFDIVITDSSGRPGLRSKPFSGFGTSLVLTCVFSSNQTQKDRPKCCSRTTITGSCPSACEAAA